MYANDMLISFCCCSDLFYSISWSLLIDGRVSLCQGNEVRHLVRKRVVTVGRAGCVHIGLAESDHTG